MKRKRARLILTFVVVGLLVAGWAIERVWIRAWVAWTYREELELLRLSNAFGLAEFRHLASGLTLVLLPGGKFEMGSRADAKGDADEKPRHLVKLSPFLVAKSEVSQAEWEKVMGTCVSYFRAPDLPVTNVYWGDCETFCEKAGLSIISEAQWEYACRGGSSDDFAFGSSLPEKGVNVRRDGSLQRPAPVQQAAENRFGLRHMHGNVNEWCADRYDEASYSRRSRPDPVLAEDGEERVVRGGSWLDPPEKTRCASRHRRPATGRYFNVGFRPVLKLDRLAP
ncbi:MAG: formylglycine-generating enzyme family protein [Planctomycetota bacterium]